MSDTLKLATARPAFVRPATNGAGFVVASLAVARRTLRKFFRTPQLIIFGALQSAIFLVMFRYVIAGGMSVEGLSYVDFLIPGFIATTVFYSGIGAAVGTADDVQQGFFDRLRSLPIPRASVLMGRALADTALVGWNVLIATAMGFAVGFRASGSLEGVLIALGLCLVFGFAVEWVFMMVGLTAGNAQAAQGMSMLVWPMVFLSSAYVPVATMPEVLQAFAGYQPVTQLIDAVRVLMNGASAEALLGQDAAHYVTLSLAWSAGLVLVFGFLAVARFSRR